MASGGYHHPSWLEEGSSPSVLLPSVKSWLCMIFSTMSSASMRVSSTQVGWLSTESFFRLRGEEQGSDRYSNKDNPSTYGTSTFYVYAHPIRGTR